MRRLILLAAFLLGPQAAMADCPGTTCPALNAGQGNFGGNKLVIFPTLHADGATSDDVALAAAAAACTAANGILQLPSGKILLTGAASINLQSCSIRGAGISPIDLTNNVGTLFLLTSTTVPPFIAHYSWSLEGVGAYWPNQTDGLTVYPPLISDTSSFSGFFNIDHVTIVNAYDGLVFAHASSGNSHISNSTMYAVHNLFSFTYTGDSIEMTNLHLTPGPWTAMCGFSSPCQLAIDAGAQHNTILDIPASATGVTVTMTGVDNFDWRYGVHIGAGGLCANCYIDMNSDNVATLIDASASGANWSAGSVWKGLNTVCETVQYHDVAHPIGGMPCFDMGVNSYLILDNYSTGSLGDVIRTAGSAVIVRNSQMFPSGSVSAPAAFIDASAGAPGEIIAQNNRVVGNGTIYSHGIWMPGKQPTHLVVQNNTFFSLDDAINVVIPGQAAITGNVSHDMAGSLDVVITGGFGFEVTYSSNQWQSPPLTTVANCGTGATITAGTLTGYVTVGSTVPTNSCQIVLPFVPAGGGGCSFFGPTAVMTGGSSANIWQAFFRNGNGDLIDGHGAILYFSCGAQQ